MVREIDPKTELYVIEKLDSERKVYDDAYAPMIVKTILYSILAILGAAVLAKLATVIGL